MLKIDDYFSLSTANYYAEPKFDGFRAIMHVTPQNLKIYSRKLEDISD